MKPFRLTPNDIEINCFDKRIEDQETITVFVTVSDLSGSVWYGSFYLCQVC